mmetsp:Transcript_17132/g.23531  ORF Transcript_17132/g.23531 Transcript_17132/m.23531 type:complete len:262 (-) Transcript_17132:144-929(-)
MHRWPAHPAKDATMSPAAVSRSQSGSATRWFLAPPSASTRLFSPRHRFASSSATGLDPTKVSARTPGWSASAAAASAVPCTIWKTPSGTPASRISAATRAMHMGTFSEGLRMTQLPATSAMGTVHMGTMMGKLKGTMHPTTPSGSRWSAHAMPRLTSSAFPCISCGIEHAHSTVSFPLATLARASALFLPPSRTTMSASSSACSAMRAWRRSITAARCLAVWPFHAGKAASALATAAATSWSEDKVTWLITESSIGESTSM